MKIKPTEQEIKNALEINEQNGSFYIFSVSCEILADLDTPVSTYHKICKKKPYSYLLESVEGGEKLGRYSLIGTDPLLLFTSKHDKTFLENINENKKTELDPNPFIALKNVLGNIVSLTDSTKNFLGFVGYFGYENIRWVEPKTGVKTCESLPDACLILPEKIVVFDHILHKVNLILNTVISKKEDFDSKYLEARKKLEDFLSEFYKPQTLKPLLLKYNEENKPNYKSNYTKEEFINLVKKAKEYIHKGDIFQIVLSQKLSIEGAFDGLSLYRALRSINPSPYLFYLNLNKFELAGSSPEVMVKLQNQNSTPVASLRPIAGTYPRGENEEEDLKNISKLLADPKERAEHIMLVDLARNDLGRVCKAGSIKTSELMVIEKYSHVLHMVSQVEGILQKGKKSIDLLSACFPAGTLSGAPKIRAMEIINELEAHERGPYGGCIGFFGLDNSINTAMTIRTFVISKDKTEIQVGAGIVSDSKAENEYNETLRKGAALLKALSLIS